MSARLAVLVSAVVLAIAAGVTVGVLQLRDYRETYGADPTVAVAGDDGTREEQGIDSGPRILFRHTGVDAEYGHLASVPLGDPAGPRSFADQECDRVAATEDTISCLVTERGVPTRFSALLLDAKGEETSATALAGVPSRTRLSPSGDLVATTVFVAGHSYMQSGFSTTTVIRHTDGSGEPIDLEDLDLVMDGTVENPVDRNYWGVTFRDDRTFWATVATGGHTYLVQGDLDTRRLTTLAENAECPSVSPDGTQVAYKVRIGNGAPPVWEIEVRNLRTGATAQYPATRGLDDQVAWLDRDTLLYGLARADQPGTTDVWSLDLSDRAEPSVLIEQAWSPAVVPD